MGVSGEEEDAADGGMVVRGSEKMLPVCHGLRPCFPPCAKVPHMSRDRKTIGVMIVVVVVVVVDSPRFGS